MKLKIKEIVNAKILLIVFVFASFIGIAVVTSLFSTAELPIQITAVLLEAIITAVMTYFLLGGQSQSEEEREKGVEVFKQKQEVYHAFLEKLNKIIEDGKVNIPTGGSDQSRDELKELIFQLGYLQMHCKDKSAIGDVVERLTHIIECMSEYNSPEEKNNPKKRDEFYTSLSDDLLKIVNILRKDLYDKKDDVLIANDKMMSLLNKCGLSVETREFQLQKYFWTKLQDLLIKKNYPIEKKDFSEDITKYYKDEKQKTTLTLKFEICTTTKDDTIFFYLELQNEEYSYGFGPTRDLNDEPSHKIMEKCVKELGGFSKPDKDWCGNKKPSDKYRLNFRNIVLSKFNSREQEKFMHGLVDEMHDYIEKFKEKAIKNNLINK